MSGISIGTLIDSKSCQSYQTIRVMTVTFLPQFPSLLPTHATFSRPRHSLTLGGQQGWLEDDGGRKGRHQAQSHELTHARCAWMMREKKAAECSGRRTSAEKDGARQARLQKPRLTGAPCHDVIDFEGDTDAQKKRKRDDIRKIELEPDKNADFEGYDDSDKERHECQRDIGPPAKRDEQNESDGCHRPKAGLEKRFHDRCGRFDDENWRSAGLRRDSADGFREPVQGCIVIAVAARRDLDSRLSVGRNPVAFQ
jgi:hypothetical protein